MPARAEPTRRTAQEGGHMAEDNKGANPAETTPQETQGEGGGTDWKAEARKWEQRAKENKAAADELAAIKERDMTEAQRAEARAQKAEQELAAMKAAESRREWAAKASKATGVPQEVLSEVNADSEESLMEKAEAMKGYFANQAAPVVASDGNAANAQGTGESANDWLRSTLPGNRH